MKKGKHQQGKRANRAGVTFKPNDYVVFNGDIFKITQVIDFQKLVGINIKTGSNSVLNVSKLSAIEDNSNNGFSHVDLEDVTDAGWKTIERRFSAIEPLIGGATRKEVEKRSVEIGKHYTTLYRWLKKYKSMAVMTVLIPIRPGSVPGSTRISLAAELAIKIAIEEHYLTRQRPSIQRVIERVIIDCKRKNILAPSKNTIRARIKNISEYDRIKRQGNKSKARTMFDPAPGVFPHANYPLSVVQIDHTPMDIILVDDEHRLSIGRPWITLAIDVYSRMITGYYLSLDAPSSASVAMCIANSILPKEDWLRLHDVDASWPVWGVMETIHVDNGADFRADTLEKSCLTYGINLEFRPVGKPNLGGHIERLLGTVLKHVHDLPGTTFSNVKERDLYDSEKNASMTFSEFERWLVTYITKVYHKRKHRTLKMSPEEKWTIGVLGDSHSAGIGLPEKRQDDQTVLLDFMPMFKRTIQKTGVSIEGLTYYDFSMRSWINVVDTKTNKKKEFVFRRDPRDVSRIWFYEPKQQMYYKLPLTNQAIPAMSLSEYRLISKRIKETGGVKSDHALINGLAELNEQVAVAQKKTKKARRSVQTKKTHKSAGPIIKKTPKIKIPDEDDLWDEDVESFD
ncbi:MAG: transposase [Piscirickettsiaceae bacterium]|nr:MAG: transposase [Piscirickettsiaceae bacterium]